MEDTATQAGGGAKPSLSANAIAQLLADFVDVLIPGDDSWPSASTVGVQAVLASRLADLDGEGAVDRLLGRLDAKGGFAGKSEAERTTIVADFERDEAELFKLVRNAVFLAYYESPAAAARVRSLGFAYELRPHIGGYTMPVVDPERDRPHHQRGFHVPTEEVRRLDLSRLEWLSNDKRDHSHGDD